MDLAIKLIVLLPLLAAAIAGLFCRIIGDRPAIAAASSGSRTMSLMARSIGARP